MKNILFKTLVLPGFLLLSISSFGQNNDDDKSKNKNIKPIKEASSESNSTELKTVNENKSQTVSIGERRKVLSTEEKIQALESHIEAIDTKVEYINSDQSLKKKAIKDNWFDKMQAIREELVNELNELKNE